MASKVNAKTLKARKRRRKKMLRRRILILTLIFVGFMGFKYKEKIFNLNSQEKETVGIEREEKVNYLDKIPEEVKSSTDPIIQSLLEKANSYPEVANMLVNIDEYPIELLDLASRKDEIIDFVYNYPKYDSSVNETISIKKDYKKGQIPLFIQWDERWGYEKYGSEFIAINGCGPTALSMVVVGLTGNTDMNPKAIADFSYEQGYLVDGVGSSWTLMSEGAESLGVNSELIPLNENVIINTLKSGQPIIASVGPGTFTTTGHFIVLTGVDKDNKIIINDPDSKIKSKQTWDIEVIMNEAASLWTYTAM